MFSTAHRIPAFLLAAILFGTISAESSTALHPSGDPDDFVDTVETRQGKLAGVPASIPGVTVYRGIRYAAAPIGELRWRPPQPPPSWPGVRSAARFGPICMQERQTPGSFYQKEFYQQAQPMSELAHASGDRPRAV